MQIIENSPLWKIEKECTSNNNGCGAILEIEAVDIYLSYQHGSNKYLYTFRCPCCNKETTIPENEIPFSIRRAILNIEQANGLRIINLRKLGYR
ncbi:MAG TPA: hypothetical protein DCE23_07185 [Firmicutes bacterium]|nr:hypothetical protein [Bacillota bacterium]